MTQLDNGWIGDNWWGRDDGGTPERVLPPRYEDPPGPGDGLVGEAPMDANDVVNQVRELLEAEAGLSGWEMDFLENMDERTSFTPKQADKIEELWQRVVG